ncbi:hypothetical protein BDN70DRAFT_871717 [Pholiota conissans]|uniref:Uncharacterized protein n=1 Tax=Pholiota conissans TaxID=109636 RepID=A0A9P5ZFN2_9AGAR|nr:hypothetical protein BDN70DRAFT_871717 [Pholiota conissans]
MKFIVKIYKKIRGKASNLRRQEDVNVGSSSNGGTHAHNEFDNQPRAQISASVAGRKDPKKTGKPDKNDKQTDPSTSAPPKTSSGNKGSKNGIRPAGR